MNLRPAYDDLLERLRRGELALYLGPDLPQAQSGAPGWPELAQALASRGGWTSTDWPSTATRYEQAAGRWNLEAWLRDQLAATRPGPLYHLAAGLPVGCYISAAYDSLLEEALAAEGRQPNVAAGVADLTFLRSERPTVVKLLGDLGAGRRQQLLLTQRDLAAVVLRRASDLAPVLQPAFTTSSLLVLGQDLRTDFFAGLHRRFRLAQNGGGFPRRTYAVWPGLESWQVEDWAAQELTVLDDDPLRSLSRLLGAGHGNR